MSVRKLTFAFVGLVLVVALVWFASEPESSRQTSPSKPDVAAAASSPAAPEERPSVKDQVAQPVPAYADSWVSNDQFFGRFPFDHFPTKSAFQGAVRRLGRDLKERKGLAARVVRSEGDALDVSVPGLLLSDEEAGAAFKAAVEGTIGAARAEEMWNDPLGRIYLKDELSLRDLAASMDFKIRKSSDGPKPRLNYRGDPVFEMELVMTAAPGIPLRSDSQNIYQGVDWWFIADDPKMGWNFMAKAPTGYFRQQPILGVASRPPPGVEVFYNVENGEAEVHNLRGEGTREKIVVPDPRIPRS